MSSIEPWRGHELALAMVGERELEREKDTDTDHRPAEISTVLILPRAVGAIL